MVCEHETDGVVCGAISPRPKKARKDDDDQQTPRQAAIAAGWRTWGDGRKPALKPGVVLCPLHRGASDA